MYLDLYYKTERTLPLKAAIFFSLNSCQKATPFWFVYVRLQSKPACLPTWWNVDIFFVGECPLSEKNIECFYLKLKGISLGKTVFCYSVCIFYFSQITELDVIFMMHHESNYVALTWTIHKWHQPGKTGGVNSKLRLYTLVQKIHQDTIAVACL